MAKLPGLIFVVGVALGGCGDDSTSTPDLSLTLDLAGAPDCATYCTTIEAACVLGSDGGDYTQYPSTTACLAYCTKNAAWPAGSTSDVRMNTLGCRLGHASIAKATPASACVVAGPSGGNVCGSWCDNYCQLMQKNCTGANAIYDPATCMSKCATMPATGQPGDTVGNTVQCRIYHLGVAFDDPVTHCPHGRTLLDNSTGPCQ
jgi:hypothetical protein